MILANAIVLGLGLALLAIPVVMHFLMQSKPKTLPFPAIRFLQMHQTTNQRQLRLRKWLLLSMRCLLILLLALALAGPAVAASDYGAWLTVIGVGCLGLLLVGLSIVVWMRRNAAPVLRYTLLALTFGVGIWWLWTLGIAVRTHQGIAPQDSTAPVTALILVDTSPRMLYQRENQTHLAYAQEQAGWVIDQLPLDSQVAVVHAQEIEPFFSLDLAAAKKQIANLEVSYVDAGLADALERSLDLLESGIHERKEIYLVTDLSRQSWANGNAGRLKDRLAKFADWNVFVVDVGTSQPLNFAIRNLQLQSSRIPQSGKLRLTLDVQRLGPGGPRNLDLLIEQPDESLPTIRDGNLIVPEKHWQQTQPLTIADNGSAAAEFQFADRLPIGLHHARIRISGSDALEVDNERFFTFEVQPAWRALIVRDGQATPDFLWEILAPFPTRADGSSEFDCTVIAGEDLNRFDLGQFQAIYWLDPRPISDAIWQKLSGFVREGGGLALFLGAEAQRGAEAAVEFQSPVARELLGFRLTIPWRCPDGDLLLGGFSQSHPLFEPFRKLGDNLSWAGLPIYYHWGVELEPEPANASVLLKYLNQQPALLEHAFGKGRVLVLTTPLSEPARPENRKRWNDLFAGDFFPTWLLTRQIALTLVQNSPDSLNVQTGELAVLRNDPRIHPLQYALYRPRTQQAPTKVTVTEGLLRYKFTDIPGQFRLKGSQEQRIVLRGFSVNLPDVATELTRLKPNELDDWLGPERYQMAREQQEITRQQGTARRGKEFYPLVVLMLTVLVALEYLLANRFYAK